MRRKIKDIVDIRIGYQHRDRANPVSMGSSGSHSMIQIKDLDREGRFANLFEIPIEYRLWTGSLYMVTPKAEAEAFAVKEGDVLFLSKGSRYLAVPMVESYVKPFPSSWEGLIAAYYFYILRLRCEDVLPEYLAWALNGHRAQSLLDSMSQGSHMKMIAKREFALLTIDVPPLAKQRHIVDLYHLSLVERRLMEKVQEKRSAIVDTLCSRAAAQETTTQERKSRD